MGRERWAAVGFLVAGVLIGALGLGAFAAGTGVFGLETATFVRIDCNSVRTKGGTVWHCTGESPAQVRANDEARQRNEALALRAHREGMPSYRPPQRTRLSFTDHDGRNDPEQITASRLPGTERWIAHSGSVTGTGVLLTLLGCTALAYGGYRLRTFHRA